MLSMKKTATFGIIHIGSIHTSMAIVNYHSPTNIEIIDKQRDPSR